MCRDDCSGRKTRCNVFVPAGEELIEKEHEKQRYISVR